MHLKLRVEAGSRTDGLTKTGPDSYRVSVRAPAERGQANRAVLELLAAELQVPAGKIRIVKGAHSPSKIVWVYR